MGTSKHTIPDHAKLNGQLLVIDGEPWSFARSVEWVLNTNPQFNGNGIGIRASVRILSAVEKKAPGDEFELRTDDRKTLSDVMESPAAGFIGPLENIRPDGTRVPLIVPGRVFIWYLDAVSEEKKD